MPLTRDEQKTEKPMKRIIIALVILVVGIQFIPVKQTNPAMISDFSGPAEVKAILQKSCYDCHSNETEWPWYSQVAPMSWLVAHDVKKGRERLNFSDWEPLKDIVWIRSMIYRQVASGQMPLKSFLTMHSDAKVSDEELATLKEWAGE
jgi:hypothetical protein